MPPCKVSVGISFIMCPSCGEPMMVRGEAWDDDPENRTAKCQNCRKVISMTADPATGELVAKVARPS